MPVGMKKITLALFLLLTGCATMAQPSADSTQDLSEVPTRFFTAIDKKLDHYTHRIDAKTGRTLARLARWEAKLKNILEKASPETAARLFGPGQLSFARVYAQYQAGQRMVGQYQQQYDQYRDELKNSIAYLDSQQAQLSRQVLAPLKATKEKVMAADSLIGNNEAIAAFIRQRRQQLITQAIQYAGKSKYLRKINSEAWYYAESLRNYKELFQDPAKREEMVMRLLRKIPAFTSFLQQNSQLAALFRVPAGYGTAQSLAGLQTRQSVEALLMQRISAAGPNGLQQVRDNMQAAQAQLAQLKEKAAQYGGGSDADMPGFKPNMTKTKTFRQRIVYDANVQFARVNPLVPTAADIALGVGYKLNDKSIIGVGASYRLGVGSLQRLRISHQGLGLRSYIDWKLKKQFYLTGGYELNHQAAFSSIAQLRDYNSWQQAALVGLAKKINIKSKWFKASKVQVLYDVLYQRHIPVGQPFVFRVGYSF